MIFIMQDYNYKKRFQYVEDKRHVVTNEETHASLVLCGVLFLSMLYTTIGTVDLSAFRNE